jgi:hypothetical protein
MINLKVKNPTTGEWESIVPVVVSGGGGGGDVNIIEEVQKNGVPLTVTNKSVNVTVPTQASDIGAQPAGTYSTDIHSNITALNAVSGTNTGDETSSTIKTKLGITTLSGSNTGDQDLSGYSLTSHNHSGVYEPANSNIQSHISNTSNPHSTTASQVGAYTSGQVDTLLGGKQNSLGFVVETENKFLRDDNTFQRVDMSVGGYANNLYYTETASDIGGYETLSYTPQASPYTETITVASSDGDKLHMNYIYPTQVTVDSIPSGVWSFTFYGKVSNNTGVTQLGVTYFARTSGGVETDLFTLWSGEINNTTDT